jgi:hypothetical protein
MTACGVDVIGVSGGAGGENRGATDEAAGDAGVVTDGAGDAPRVDPANDAGGFPSCARRDAGAQQSGDAGPPPPPNAKFPSDPTPTSTAGTRMLVLRKNLSGYPSYGAGEGGNADILYTNQTAAWTFTVPDDVVFTSAEVALSLVLDDHSSVDAVSYAYAVWIGSGNRFAGPANLPHGAPYGAQLTNWVERTYRADCSASTYTITLKNLSAAVENDWIAVDWIELRLAIP